MTYLRDITEQSDDHEDVVRNVWNEDYVADSRRNLIQAYMNHFWSVDNKLQIGAIEEAQRFAERLGVEMANGRLWVRIADKFDEDEGIIFIRVMVPQPNDDTYH